MKAIILAAGKGTRMLPLTEKVPKVLIEINGKPFLYYLMHSLQKAGYNDFGLVVGYLQEKIQEFVDKYHFPAQLIEQKEQKGTGDALWQARHFIGKEDFLMLGGDNLWSVEDFKLIGQKDEFNYICAVEAKHPERYGVILIDKNDNNNNNNNECNDNKSSNIINNNNNPNYLLRILEKPTNPPTNLINTGLFKFKPEIITALEKIKLSPRGEMELTDAVSLLAQEKKVKVLAAKWWLDLGCLEDIPKVSKFLEEEWRE